MTIRILLAAALLVPAVAGAQGWGDEGNDPNAPAAAQPAAAPAPAQRSAPKIRPKAETKAVRYDDGGYELGDADLDRGRALVDLQLIARKAELAAQTERLDGYHKAMEKDSVDAERQMAEERKAFLLYLKSVPQEDRADAMKHFEERQADKRKELDKRHLAQYKAWFDENIKDNWRTQPLAAEEVTMARPVAQAPAAAAEVAKAEPVKHPVHVVHAKPKAKRRVVRRARTSERAQARGRMHYSGEPVTAQPPAPAAAPAASQAPAPVQAAAQPR